jgi:glucose-6-phosphate isomerase
MLNHYLEGKANLLYPDGEDVFPCELIHSQLCK